MQVRPVGYEKKRKLGMILEDSENLNGRIMKLKLPDDAVFAPRLEREGLLRMGTVSRGVNIVGINPLYEKKISEFDEWLVDGVYIGKTNELDRTHGIIPCMIGYVNAQKMELGPGDTVVISIGDKSGTYKSKKARITGIFRSPAEPIDKYTVIVKREDLSEFYTGREDAIGYFVFMGNNLDNSDSLKKYLTSSMTDFSGKIEILSYVDLQPTFRTMLEFSQTFSLVCYVIMMIGFGIILFDAVTMSVYERIREIGVVRALGAKPLFLFFQVIFESVLLTVVGSLAGIVVGGALSIYFYIFGLDLSAFAQGMELMARSGSVIYPYLTISNLAGGMAIAISVSFIAGIYPAWKAVRISPVKAIYNR